MTWTFMTWLNHMLPEHVIQLVIKVRASNTDSIFNPCTRAPFLFLLTLRLSFFTSGGAALLLPFFFILLRRRPPMYHISWAHPFPPAPEPSFDFCTEFFRNARLDGKTDHPIPSTTVAEGLPRSQYSTCAGATLSAS